MIKIVIINSHHPRIAVTLNHDVFSSFNIVISQSAFDADRLDALKREFERMLEVHQKGKVILDQLMLRLNEREKLTTSLRSVITIMRDIFFILSISTKHIFSHRSECSLSMILTRINHDEIDHQ